MKKCILVPFGSLSVGLALTCALWNPALAAPPGPDPQVPDGGSPPGPFPNTSVTAVSVDARGGATYDGNVEIPGLIGQGPIPWSINRYNRGDIALRLAPADPEAALNNLDQGYIEYGESAVTLPEHHAWRPSPLRGVVIPTVLQNGPIDWGDAQGGFFPTIAISESSSGPGYDMVTGAFGNGNLDINLGKAGTASEANFPFSATWFPYDQGWIGGEAAGPDIEGNPSWTSPNAHSTGITPGAVRWPDYPTGSFVYGGLAEVDLPGVSTTQGMLFAVSSDGSSDVNIVGVVPREDHTGWIVAMREDSATDGTTLVAADQSEFQFVYIPYDSPGLIGGHYPGTGVSASDEYAITRTAAGTYELTISGKTATDGTLILQAAEEEPGTAAPILPTRAFLSAEYDDTSGKFIIQARVTTSETDAALRDTGFYFAWIDFAQPLTPPPGPTLRSIAPIALTPEFTIFREAALGINTDEPEVLVTTVDSQNLGSYTDPITGEFATSALVGYFINPITMEQTRDPFIILGSPRGEISKHDVVYNPVSKQYNIVAGGRGYSPTGNHAPLVAIVNPNSVAGANDPVVRAFAYDQNTTSNYDDMVIAASAQNGNFLVVAEIAVSGEGEGTVGILFDQDGDPLVQQPGRIDNLQPTGDEDDPDIIYLDGLDVFLYTSNTDLSGGLGNRVTGAVVQTTPTPGGALQVGTEQPLATGRFSGVAEGHPASILSPFNGEIITVFDLGGNNVERGGISYVDVGPAPGYAFTQAQSEGMYLNGTPGTGDPFRHNHPQIAVDPDSGVFLIGHNANQSTVGNPDAYVFTLLGPNGELLPSQLGTPYFYAETPGGTANSAFIHDVKYSPLSDSFIVVFNTSPGTTYVGSIEVTSNHLDGGDAPELTVTKSGSQIVVSWPDTATGFVLQSTDSLSNPNWMEVSTTPTQSGGMFQVTIDPSAPARFYRLVQE